MKISKCPTCNEELTKHSHDEKAYYCLKKHEYISARLCKTCNKWIDIEED